MKNEKIKAITKSAKRRLNRKKKNDGVFVHEIQPNNIKASISMNSVPQGNKPPKK